ncbi:glycine--tRNA ligase subunit beta [Desulfoluna butyratoxydans]|uniref:Glycine--tRNA ligase beta subunit n=1 Tax=Desulfoluna butyratoxydans TaxID=231438 RepID=A0A4U8YRX2_9BACT|nr:glycine--tRNA ligase subunit beta [Desulfoluna butyratoxydans]VFQ46651.1 glycine-trna ligase beta subunit [Desulfoluna butyratoxydans]
MKTLLFEIGTEEIPAGYIRPALDFLAAAVADRLKENRIDAGEVSTYGTPRRLTVMVKGVAEGQKAETTEVTGPPESVGYEADGTPKMPAVKFAEKVGIDVSEIQIKETKKGRYLCASVAEEVKPSVEVLSEILPELIHKVPFPKTMRWADLSVTFARPVQNIVALLGETVIPFSFGNVTSGNASFGHRFMNPGPVVIDNPDAYLEILEKVNVIADFDARRVMVKERVTEAAKEAGGVLLPDEELFDTVTNLIEYPVVVIGTFDEDFLAVPDEVLITSMREHQKYFAVVDEAGKLKNAFLVVNNTRVKDLSLVRRGHEKVLRARLADAKFFFDQDLKETPDAWVERLKGVLFQAKLGTVHEKVGRIRHLAGVLARVAEASADTAAHTTRAAELCKADLVSHMVVEFTKLQGVMGRVYAERAGEDAAVAAAIQEHYKPLYSGGELPQTEEGALLALADKLDTLCGCFAAGLIPTGGADPYALRRQAIGIAQIMVKMGYAFPLRPVLEEGVAAYADRIEVNTDETVAAIIDFFRGRIDHLLFEEGYAKDVVASVTSVGINVVPDIWMRVKALSELKEKADFEAVAAAFKRVVNIIKKADLSGGVPAVDTSLFEHESEKELVNAFAATRTEVEDALKDGGYDKALTAVAGLRPSVDRFFEDVMVMAEDADVRANRLAILAGIAGLFGDIADFSKLSA